ncbi:transcriptional repressor NrdR [bacterium]|nr:transcriptional repressor NrdR [bacterium]
MKCPFCHSLETKVIETRESKDGFVTRRRRECLNQICNERFTTREYIEKTPVLVLKSNGATEEFELEKLAKGIRLACRKRPISNEKIDQIATEIEKEIQNTFAKEVKSREIGELVMKKLKETDQIAYVRFASVYRNFTDVSEFAKEISSLQQ